MKAYHGTTTDNKEEIIKNGFRIDAVRRNGRMYGHAVYLTTRKEWAREFGDAMIEVEIKENDIEFFDDGYEILDLWQYHLENSLSPYKSMDDYVYDGVRSFKGKFTDALRLHGDSVYNEAELKVGTAMKEDFINQGVKGFAVLFLDKETPYYDITIYDTSIMTILKD